MRKYVIWDETYALLGSGTATWCVQRDVPLGRSLTVCVGAQYPYNVRQDKTAPCIQIQT